MSFLICSLPCAQILVRSLGSLAMLYQMGSPILQGLAVPPPPPVRLSFWQRLRRFLCCTDLCLAVQSQPPPLFEAAPLLPSAAPCDETVPASGKGDAAFMGDIDEEGDAAAAASSSSSSSAALAPSDAAVALLRRHWKGPTDGKGSFDALLAAIAALPRMESGTPALHLLDIRPFLNGGVWKTHAGVYVWVFVLTKAQLIGLETFATQKLAALRGSVAAGEDPHPLDVTLVRLLEVCRNVRAQVGDAEPAVLNLLYGGCTVQTGAQRYSSSANSLLYSWLLDKAAPAKLGVLHRGFLSSEPRYEGRDAAGKRKPRFTKADVLALEAALQVVLGLPVNPSEQAAFFEHDSVIRVVLNRMPMGLAYSVWSQRVIRKPGARRSRHDGGGWYQLSEADVVLEKYIELNGLWWAKDVPAELLSQFEQYLRDVHGFKGETINEQQVRNFIHRAGHDGEEQRVINSMRVLSQLLKVGYAVGDRSRGSGATKDNEWTIGARLSSREFRDWYDEMGFLNKITPELMTHLFNNLQQEMTERASAFLQREYGEWWNCLPQLEREEKTAAGWTTPDNLTRWLAKEPIVSQAVVDKNHVQCDRCDAIFLKAKEDKDTRSHMKTHQASKKCKKGKEAKDKAKAAAAALGAAGGASAGVAVSSSAAAASSSAAAAAAGSSSEAVWHPIEDDAYWDKQFPRWNPSIGAAMAAAAAAGGDAAAVAAAAARAAAAADSAATGAAAASSSASAVSADLLRQFAPLSPVDPASLMTEHEASFELQCKCGEYFNDIDLFVEHKLDCEACKSETPPPSSSPEEPKSSMEQ